jgi:hypothetical protein
MEKLRFVGEIVLDLLEKLRKNQIKIPVINAFLTKVIMMTYFD